MHNLPEGASQEFESFFYRSNNLFCVLGIDGEFKSLNPAIEKVFLSASEKAKPCSLFTLLIEEDRKTLQTIMDQAYRNGSSILRILTRLDLKDRELRYFSWNMTPQRSQLWGDVFYCHAVDETETHHERLRVQQISEALVRSQRQFQHIAESIPGVVFQLVIPEDGPRRFIYVNSAAREILGLNPEEMLKDPEITLRALHPEDLTGYLTSLERSRQQMQTFKWEGRYIVAPDDVRWIQVSARPTYYSATEMLWDGIVVDITSKVTAEQLLLEQQQRFLHASKMATLGEMASGIAHEINNPLTIITGRAQQLKELAQKGVVNQETVQTLAERIEATAFRIFRIIRGLQLFSREGSKDPFTETPLQTIIEDTLELCSRRLRDDKIRLKVGDFKCSLALECRPVQISQLLVNLLTNSCDAVANRERREIEIAVEESENSIQIKVIDSGHGISPELREKVQLPFFTTNPPGRGTGLGLSICQAMADAHNGRIYLDDKATRTTFVIELPKRQIK